MIQHGSIWQTGNALLEAPFAPDISPHERLDQVGETADQLANIVFQTFAERGNRGPGYRASMLLACQPSLEVFAVDGVHAEATAEAVAENVQSLADFVIDRAQLHNNPGRLKLGTASEIAILGLGWWGIATGRLASDSYLLPATQAEDASSHAGAGDGVDLFMRVGGFDQTTRPLQSKTKRRANAPVGSGVVSVSPKQLIRPMPGDHLTTLRLITYLAKGDEAELSYAFDRLLERFDEVDRLAA